MDKPSLLQVEGADFDEPSWNCIIGKMFFPDNTARRREFLPAVEAEELRNFLRDTDGRAELRIPADLMSDMFEQCLKWSALSEEAIAPLARDTTKSPGPGHGGRIAGLTLLIPLIVWRKTRRRAGRGQAYQALVNLGVGVSKRTLQANWTKYQSVAHIWAAAWLRPELVGNPDGLIEFIGLAQQLRDEGTAYVSARERETLLPPDADNLDLIDLKVLGISEAPRCPEWIDCMQLPPEFARLIGVSA